MNRNPPLGYWRPPYKQRDTESHWRGKEVAVAVVTRSGLETGEPTNPVPPREEELPPPTNLKANPVRVIMAEENDNDPEIESLHKHQEGEPSQTIVVTQGQKAIHIKSNVLQILPTFHGRLMESPYNFLDVFYKVCSIQSWPDGSTEEQYRLKALPFALKGDVNTWLVRLPPNSITTWADFKLAFLDYYFPSTRTSSLRQEIQGATQDYDETLGPYWDRFQGLLSSCPNHRMTEVEIYSAFYEVLTNEGKHSLNIAAGGDFSKIRLSEAKRILGRLINAKNSYESPHNQHHKRGSANAAEA